MMMRMMRSFVRKRLTTIIANIYIARSSGLCSPINDVIQVEWSIEWSGDQPLFFEYVFFFLDVGIEIAVGPALIRWLLGIIYIYIWVDVDTSENHTSTVDVVFV